MFHEFIFAIHFMLSDLFAAKIKTKNKKSAGVDGIAQDILVMGALIVAQPLTTLINK